MSGTVTWKKSCRECGEDFLASHGSVVYCSAWCRFWAKVEIGDCWSWTRAKNTNGYGTFAADGRHWVSHVWAWTQLVGPVPDGLELDHLCRNRSCVNPDHLEPVTHKVNMRRGLAGEWQRAKTTCRYGHELTAAKLQRVCLKCKAASTRRRRLRRLGKEAQDGR